MDALANNDVEPWLTAIPCNEVVFSHSLMMHCVIARM